MGAKHTPGPWFIGETDDDGRIIIRAPDGDDDPWYIADVEAISPPGAQQANARLIAAAPELLSMLKTAAAQFRFYEQLHLAKGTEDGCVKAAANADLASVMEAVIAKAEGR